VKLAIDIDNCVLEWQYHWARLYEQWFSEKLDQDALGSWNACLDLTKFENMDQFYAWYSVADGWDTQPYVYGAKGFLWELRQDKVHYEFVTSRPWDGEEPAKRLARRESTTVLFRGNQAKWTAHADLWVDDSPEVLTSLVEHGKRAVRFDQPWNRDLPKKVEKQLLVATTWPEVRQHVDKIRKEEGL